MTIWQLVRLAIVDNELWTDYATLVCIHACDILSLNCLFVIVFCSTASVQMFAVVSLVFNNTFYVPQCGVCVNNFKHALLATMDLYAVVCDDKAVAFCYSEYTQPEYDLQAQ